jgi:hypothetical protein
LERTSLPTLSGLVFVAGVALAAAAGCEKSADEAPASGTNEPGAGGNDHTPPGPGAGGEPGDFAPGGECDIQALMALPENGCTNAGCHGAQYQGNLDLVSPGVGDRLRGVASQSDACGGELLIDPSNVDDSLLLRVLDPARFASSPCGVMMPLGNSNGVSPSTLLCFEAWVKELAAGGPPVTDPPTEFEPVAADSYTNKVKTLLIGGAATSEEVAKVSERSEALRDLIGDWLETPEFEEKLADFLSVALQQKLVGSLDAQFMRLRGSPSRLSAFKANLQESFVRTAVALVREGRPFTEILTTRRWAMTTASLSALAFLERTAAELKGEKHRIVRVPPDGAPSPIPLDYSIENHVWQVASLPEDCEVVSNNADLLLEMLLGFVDCKGAAAYRFEDTLLTDADFSDWRMVDLEPTEEASVVPVFFDLPTLRAATSVPVRQPRIGFFTTPSFLANWETNEDNQFRVTTSQTVITALGEIFSPADPTQPVRLDGLAKEHAQPGTACYGCHQFLDPMREYFAQSFSFDFQRPERTSGTTPSFAFQGYVHDGGGIAEFAQALADHPGFAKGWTQKLCYWANSRACSEKDPEFVRVTQAFAESHFDLKALFIELLSSPLVTGATETESFATNPPLVSITRKQHLCQLLDTRLGTPDACGVATAFASLVPEDDFSRGSAEPVQTSVTGLFHYAAAEKLCARLATRLVGTTSGAIFSPAEPDAALDAFVEKLMGLDSAHPRHDGVRQSLGDHFTTAKASTNAATALRSAFMVACVSPEVQAVGL